MDQDIAFVLPKVSIVMPVYNAGLFLKESVESMLTQSFGDFEFIIINDGSLDNTKSIIESYADNRIKLIDFKDNKGLAYALNSGLKEARGKYIVRMDADDISYPDRIDKQVKFMEANPDVGVCGTLAYVNGKYPMNTYKTPESLKVGLMLDSVFVHSTTILRNSVVKQHNLTYEGAAEDYRFWVKFSRVSKLAVLPEVLLDYRLSEMQYSVQSKPSQLEDANRIRKELYESLLNRTITSKEFDVISIGSNRINLSFVQLLKFVREVEIKNTEYDGRQLKSVLRKVILRNVYRINLFKTDVLNILLCRYLSVKERLSLLKFTFIKK